MPPNKQPRAGLPIWWIVSIAFHAVVLTWLVSFSPVKVESVIANALQTRAGTELKQLDALQRESAAAQARATEAQHRALEKLAVSDKRFSDAYQTQAEANVAQERATRAQDAARATRDEAKSSKTREAQQRVASVSNTLAQAQKDFAGASAELVTLTNTLLTAQAGLAQMDTNSAQGLKKFADARRKSYRRVILEETVARHGIDVLWLLMQMSSMTNLTEL